MNVTALAAGAVAASLVLAACGANDNGGAFGPGPSVGAAASTTPVGALRGRLPAAIAERGVLRVGLDAPSGLDADLAAALARVLGVTPSVTAGDASSLLAEAGVETLDVALTTAADRASSRSSGVDFVDDRRGASAVVVAKGVKAAGIDDLCGRTVAVATATAAADALAGHVVACPGRGRVAPHVVTVASDADATAAIVTGRAMAAVEDGLAAQAAADNSLAPHELMVAGPVIDPVFYGVAIAHADQPLVAAVQAALDALMADGTYGAILARWGAQATAVAKATVNGV